MDTIGLPGGGYARHFPLRHLERPLAVPLGGGRICEQAPEILGVAQADRLQSEARCLAHASGVHKPPLLCRTSHGGQGGIYRICR